MTTQPVKHYPLVLFLFKRPANTQKLLSLALQAGVTKIYAFSDGHRLPAGKKAVTRVREIVTQFAKVNPEIKVIKQYALKNIGLKNSISFGLNYVFAHEDAAIILEDDCIPHPDFFPFVSQMLTKYHDDRRVMSITGTSVGQFSPASYDFSQYQQCWGWATWKRSWDLFDPQLSHLDELSWPGPYVQWYWLTMLHLVRVGQVKSWAFIWSYTHFYHQGLAVIPSVNLISNNGFDSVATNTLFKSSLANRETRSLAFPLIHPTTVQTNQALDMQILRHYYQTPIAILGLIRQYFYWVWRSYAHRD